jgi:hypothetical protein
MYDPKTIIDELKNLKPGVSIGVTCPVCNNLTGKFWVVIYFLPNNLRLALLCEIPNNDGPSITNSLKYVAEHVLKTYKLDPSNTVVVEHYSENAYKGKVQPSFDIAQWLNGDVSWKPMKESIALLDKGDVWKPEIV